MNCLFLCAHRDPGPADRLEAVLREAGTSLVQFERFSDGEALEARALEARAAGKPVAVIFSSLDPGGVDGVQLLRRLHDDPSLRGTKKVLLATAAEAGVADELLQRGALHGRLDPDFDAAALRRLLRNVLTDYVVHTAPHLIDGLHQLLDLRALSAAFVSARENLQRLNARFSEVQRPVIGLDPRGDEQVEAALIREIDRLFNQPPRRHYRQGEVLVREGDARGIIRVIQMGQVKLFRTIDGEDVTFHSESAGRIVGLMSLSLHSPTFFSCRAVTDVTAIELARDQVRDGIRRSPDFSNFLITVILRSMARRNRRATQLLLQVRSLNQQLATQRDDLELALGDLRSAQDRLIESEKMATLGNMAAGMAHELNNPVAAILHAAGFLLGDVRALLEAAPALAAAAAAMPAAYDREPLSTRDERRLRAELAAELAIPQARAARLVAAGLREAAEVTRLQQRLPAAGHAKVLEQIEHGGQIGAALRNITNCSQRIDALVSSLKLYARQDPAWVDGVDVHRTIDDVLLILGSRLRRLEVTKQFEPLPPLRCVPGQLQQVWTNLLQNALQAIEGAGHITIRTSPREAAGVRVEIEDDGPGIPAEVKELIFDPRFTSKSGRVEFGLGLGLPICRSIIERHGGSIHFDSHPGRTVFTVELPFEPPPSAPPHHATMP